MNNASAVSCDILYRPTDPRYSEGIRQFQGCPTLATTPGGRIYLGWYSGGWKEPHMDNYNLLMYSDDRGASWQGPLIVIPSSRERFVHALDIQLWTDPKGRLHVFWVQNNTKFKPEVMPEKKPGQPLVAVDEYLFDDFLHSEWELICDDPDAAEPVFGAPRCLDIGFLRCKPLWLGGDKWINFNYDQEHDRYGYSITHDGGETYEHMYGAQKLGTHFDESMAYVRNDGSIRMLARTWLGELAESTSCDGGLTWSEARLSGIPNPNTRFYINRTPSGKVFMAGNDHNKQRTNMTLYLSDDDGATWKYSRCIDTRADLSYPDADFIDGKICLTYDRERTGAKEIFFAMFTEEDIMDPERPIDIKIVSKP